MLKRTAIITAVILAVPTIAIAVPAPKVTICHATSSETNPWVRIVVSENATQGHFEENGTPEAGHEEDVLLEGDVACPVADPVTPDPVTPTPPTPPVIAPNPTVPTPVTTTHIAPHIAPDSADMTNFVGK